MSGGRFLGSVLAAREGAYFLQQSKAAVGNLLSRDRVATATDLTPPPSSSTADVLPEVLRHSLPLSPPHHSPTSSSSSSSSKWTIPSAPMPHGGASLNPLSAYISLPQATFGPKRWELPRLEHAVIASTANELRTDRYSRVRPENVKAVAAGVAQVGKAFVMATILIFGGATCACSIATSKLRIHSSDDIKVRTRDILQPKVKVFKDQVVPLQAWIESRSRKWHIEGGDIKERPMVKELLKTLGGRSSS